MKLFGSILFGMVASVMFVHTAAAEIPKPAFPSWSTQFPGFKRFIVLSAFGGEAVLDVETGLVWERVPDMGPTNWGSAQVRCNASSLGNRKGWRLPTIQELASLVDPSVKAPGPTLPEGHPFDLGKVQLSPSSYHWSATTDAVTGGAWVVTFYNGDLSPGADKGDTSLLVWCVRGGQGVDPQ